MIILYKSMFGGKRKWCMGSSMMTFLTTKSDCTETGTEAIKYHRQKTDKLALFFTYSALERIIRGKLRKC